MKSIMTRFVSIVALAAAACGSEAAPGTMEIRIYGQDTIEQGIPAEVFSDGWAVSFDVFLISVGQISVVAGHDTPPGLSTSQFRIFDLTQPSDGLGYDVIAGEVPGGTYDHVGFQVARDPRAISGNVGRGPVDLMIQGGYSLYLQGAATKDGVTKSFTWSFSNTTFYDHCDVVVDVDGSDHTVEITIHGDHLFHDDLVAEEPNVAFQLIADADVNQDGAVSPAELEAMSIVGQERYQTGSLDIDNLWDFIQYQTGTLAHVQGEGRCEVTR